MDEALKHAWSSRSTSSMRRARSVHVGQRSGQRGAVEMRLARAWYVRRSRGVEAVPLGDVLRHAGSPRSRGAVGARRSRRLLSLRDTARAMSQENVEVVAALRSACRARDSLCRADWQTLSSIAARRLEDLAPALSASPGASEDSRVRRIVCVWRSELRCAGSWTTRPRTCVDGWAIRTCSPVHAAGQRNASEHLARRLQRRETCG